MGVPPNTWRWTSDAWNGYHSIPLDERDRHVTTFLTPWGRMRYRVAPQGSLSSGDGYTYWYDLVIRHMQRIKKCVDDVVGWAKALVQLFHDTAHFLSYTGSHGIIQNPAKFVWGKQELEYVGFWLKTDGVKPTEETLAAITNFPRPKDITGIRSWYGLIEQVSFSFTKTTLMQPFRLLLSKNAEFSWSPQLQEAFDLAKTEIVKLVTQGVKSFMLDTWTCIVTDWSRTGVGYVMWQKRCKCQDIHPTCCPGGWVIISCGSRFCTAAEQRYHPIEGELLGVTWALQKTGYYTLGCEKLLVLVDHKPLIGLLQSRNLGEIDNPRLLHLVERLLRWKFSIKHIAGAQNFAPDALSRYPARPSPGGDVNQVSGESTPELQRGQTYDQVNSLSLGNSVPQEDQQYSEALEAQILATSATRRLLVISWDTVKTAAISDKKYAELLNAIQTDGEEWPESLAEYKKYRQDITSVDGVALYKGRVVGPELLRPQTLQVLHLAHQGESGMVLRTHESVWWPGITNDVTRTRAACTTCHRNAPTQSPLPPVQPPTPQYPFQLISSDYFNHEGHNYLVIVDRYSNWPVLKRCKTETAEELISALREFFCSYSVPLQLTSDGAPTYLADATQQFLKNWGVEHRVSTSYNPHANLRSETAVKSMKRLIADNTGPQGSLNTDSLAAALLSYRNTPDRDTQRSLSQILYARQMKDALPCNPANLQLRPEWVLKSRMREKALACRYLSRHTDLSKNSKELKPLAQGDVVQVQNQRGNHANKWDLSGTVIEVQPFDAYLIKMDGTGRITKRNRRFLKSIVPFHNTQDHQEKLPLQQFNNNLSRQSTQTDDMATAAADKSPIKCLPHTDTPDTADDDFNTELPTAVQRVQQPARQKSRTDPTPNTNTREKRVKFATKRYIEQC